MLAKLKGKKTFIVAAVSIVWAIVGAIAGLLSPDEALNVALAALAVAGLRDAV